jgi:small subunit ribosomal protein S2
MTAELERLESHLGGVADMKRQPDALLVVDLRKEAIAVREARRLGLPVVALVDTNCDPDEADLVIPGNDDAIKSCDLVIRTIADAMEAGKQKVKPEEFGETPAAPPVRDSGPVEKVSAEPGGSPGPEEGVENRAEPEEAAKPEEGIENRAEPEEAPKPEQVPAE